MLLRRTFNGLLRPLKNKSSNSLMRTYATTEGNASMKKPRVWPFYFAVGSLLGGSVYLLSNRGGGPSEDGVSGWQRVTRFFTSLEEPAFEKLLPDAVIDPQHPRPYTLVIDLDKFLVCHIWDREQGRWRIAKRPGAEIFLFYAAQLYEVVVFSSLPQHEGDAVVKKLDPYGCISYSLYRFATHHKNGVYLKDVARLNRDPAKVIVLGHDEAGFSPHPENFIKMSPWLGDSKDKTLEQCIDFIEMLAFSRIPDVRTVAEKYKGQEFPTAFERAQENAYEAAQKVQQNSLLSRIASFLAIGRPKSNTQQLTLDGSGYEGRKVERIETRRKEYERIKDLMQKQLQSEMQKEKEYYAEHKMTLWDLFSKGPPTPPPS